MVQQPGASQEFNLSCHVQSQCVVRNLISVSYCDVNSHYYIAAETRVFFTIYTYKYMGIVK